MKDLCVPKQKKCLKYCVCIYSLYRAAYVNVHLIFLELLCYRLVLFCPPLGDSNVNFGEGGGDI
jgi:hypothetical protein